MLTEENNQGNFFVIRVYYILIRINRLAGELFIF